MTHTPEPGLTLVIDTETNGKRPKYSQGLVGEPYMIQLAAGLFTDAGRMLGCMSCFCIPEWEGKRARIPEDPFFVDNGLTDEVIDLAGQSYLIALGMLDQFLKLASRVVAHNMAFDAPIIEAAYMRCGRSMKAWMSLPLFCTMETLTPVLNLPGRYGPKWPKLEEAYAALVDPAGFEGAHDAMSDVRACAALLPAMAESNLALHAYRFPEEQ